MEEKKKRNNSSTGKTTAAKTAGTKTAGAKAASAKAVDTKTAGSKNGEKKQGSGTRKTSRQRSRQVSSKSVENVRRTGRQELDLPDITREPGTPVWAEILLWSLLAFCIILMLSNFFGIGGTIGNAVSGAFFGIFGIMAQLVPFLLFLAAAFLVANRGNAGAWAKVTAGFLLLLCICAVCELLNGEHDVTRTFAEVYKTGMVLKTGGGVAGALLYRILCPVFGLAGAWLFVFVLGIIAVIILTGDSLIDRLAGNHKRNRGLKNAGSEMRKEMYALKKEQKQLQRQQRMQSEIERMRAQNRTIELDVKEPRRNRKVTGVSWDTTVDTGLPVPEEIHEVTPKVRKNVIQQDAISTTEIKPQEPVVKPHPIMQQNPVIQQEPVLWQDSGLSGNRARMMVDSVADKPEAKQLDLNFTIYRDGVREEIREMRSSEPAVKKMPSLAEQEGEKKAVVQEEITPEETIPEENLAENMAAEQHSVKQIRNPKSSKEEQQAAVEDVAMEIAQLDEETKPEYVFPPVSLLARPQKGTSGNSDSEVRETAVKLQNTLHNFGVNVTVTNVSCGPSVTRYELLPEQGVKVSRIVNLSDDIKLNLAAADIRIEAPIPGKPAVGIEVPNKENSAVLLRELIESDEFQNASSNLSFAVGKDIAGKVVVADIAKMPHLLIAGATGSGKSVCINTLIMSILYKADPQDVKLIMIDPKVVELSVYNGIPHLFIPVVTDPKKASGALNWAVAEMTERYQKFAKYGVRDLKGYNAKIEAIKDIEDPEKPKKLPQIVIIVDELADLMMVAPGEVEDAICRLAQLARACGIHLIIATQRPSVNVITGLIKANMPSRIAFSVSSGVDSRTIIDMNGAEKLLGKGDMLFYPQGYQKPARVQGAFVSDREVSDVVEFLTQKNDAGSYSREMEEQMSKVQSAASSSMSASSSGGDIDSNFVEAGKFIIEKEKASIGMLQRVFKIGFNRAARIMDQLSEAGVVGPEEGTKPRKVLMTMEEFEQYIDEFL